MISLTITGEVFPSSSLWGNSMERIILWYFFLFVIFSCGKQKIPSFEEKRLCLIPNKPENFDKVANAIYNENEILNIHIKMNREDWEALKEERIVFSRNPQNAYEAYSWYKSEFYINGFKVEDAKVRKKSWHGSFSKKKPGLKLKKKVKGADYFFPDWEENPNRKIERLTLNNSVQDVSLVRQCLSYKLFRMMGMVAPRCQLASVCVNGERMGPYVNVEPIKKDFIEKNIGHSNIALYEGASLVNNSFEEKSDFWEDGLKFYEPKKGERVWEESFKIKNFLDIVDNNKSEISGKEVLLFKEVLDIENFYNFYSGELITTHWDGYTEGQNNHYFYYDYISKKIVLIPWGVDETFKKPFGVIYKKANLTKTIFKNSSLKKGFVAHFKKFFEGTKAIIPELDEFLEKQRKLLQNYLLEKEKASVNKQINELKRALEERLFFDVEKMEF